MAVQFMSSCEYRLRESVSICPSLVLVLLLAFLCLGPSCLSVSAQDNATSVTPTADYENATTSITTNIATTDDGAVTTARNTTVDVTTDPEDVTTNITSSIVIADGGDLTATLSTTVDVFTEYEENVTVDFNSTIEGVGNDTTDGQTIEYDENVTVEFNSTTEGVGNYTTDGQTIDSPLPMVAMRITVSYRNNSDITDDLKENERLTSLLAKEIQHLYSNTTKFKDVRVVRYRNGSVIVDVKLTFTSDLSVRERNDVVTTLFEIVRFNNGTLGALRLQDLKLLNENGVAGQVKDLNDACDIWPCLRDDMICRADGIKCVARCNYNQEYCRRDSTCTPNKDYIFCRCKKGYFGERCDKTPKAPGRRKDDNAYIGIIVAAGTAVVLFVVVVVGCGYNRLANRGKSYDTSGLFSAENPVALEMLDEPPPIIGGVACQTIESFLLAKYMKHGVPPKPGFQHEVVQTNASFLLDKYQQEHEALLDSPSDATGTTPPAPPAAASVPSTLDTDGRDSPADRPVTPTEPGDQGISNEAFVDDDADIVPTAEMEGGDTKAEIGKKIIKV